VEDYAIDLHDFHAASRTQPIVPILIAEHASAPVAHLPLLLDRCVAPVQDASADSLQSLLSTLLTGPPLQARRAVRSCCMAQRAVPASAQHH
jgi:hypothetical protein